VEKLQQEISKQKEAHRREIQSVISSKQLKGIAELKHERERKEAKERKAVTENEIYLTNAYYEKRVIEVKREWVEEVRVLNEIVWRQTAEIERLKEENAGLRGIMNQNSGNSSKPPSSDGYKKTHNSRKSTGKKAGGQKGHTGHIPKLYDNPTKIIEIKAKRCECGGRYQYSDENYSRKQHVDIEIVTNITEYREYAAICECCGSKSRNRAPVLLFFDFLIHRSLESATYRRP